MGILNRKKTDTKPVEEPKEFVHPGERFYSAEEIQRKEGESQADYNARIPVGVQPIVPVADKDYLGRPRA